METRDILEKLAHLPITTWSHTNSSSIRHLGPVAQDFAAAFGLGEGDKHIATVDADGVLFASVQGLNQPVDARIADLQRQMVLAQSSHAPRRLGRSLSRASEASAASRGDLPSNHQADRGRTYERHASTF